MRISVVGLGKAGLPLAAVIADAGMDIVGLDTDESRIAMINEKKNPIPEEPGLKEIIEQRIGVNFHATSSYEEAVKSSDVHIVIVPLFIDDEHRPDFSILDSAFESVGKNMKKGDLVVLETTVPVGTTKGRIKDLLEKASGLTAGSDFFLAYSPERIMTGHSISRYKEFPKVVGGIDKESTDKAFDIYSKFCGKVDKVQDSSTAEMIKISEGVYRDVNIALANELLKVCNRYGVDFWEMREKANHQYCNIHEPGNVGGHCIPVYPWFLINDNDVPLIKEARLL
ncbi:nucleotide sugar dehydrogenase, partial [Candidatus Woesearchaeota archaeon]|nr:nucleotide sugar dehydrogenase [Candidatus Woesearchaeota archaeon]